MSSQSIVAFCSSLAEEEDASSCLLSPSSSNSSSFFLFLKRRATMALQAKVRALWILQKYRLYHGDMNTTFPVCIVDRETFAVKIILTNRKNLTREKTLMLWWSMNKCACTSTPPRGKCPIDDYSQWYLALLTPGSRLSARNAPGARPYCNCQPLKNFMDRTNGKNLTP